MKKKYKVIVYLLVFSLSLFLLSGSNSLSITDNSSITSLVRTRINEIRSTQNTDVSKVTGTIYYVSNDGDDSNDGKSQSKPLKTTAKVNELLGKKTIKKGDAVLFRDGDTFKGSNLTLKDHNILFGSYGTISKGKPKIHGSEANAATTGSWVKVSGNVWKYQVDGKDKKFPKDVGAIWFFCKSGNNNCKRTTTDGKTKYSFGDKRMSNDNVTESESFAVSQLTKDLQFYHMGHASESSTTGGVLYLYSASNPSTRFDDIEISLGDNGIKVGNFSDTIIDNLEISFFGRHAIAINNVANVTVTNCEISYIGGMVQKYDTDGHWGLRLGNGIQSYGAIDNANGYTVKDGYVARNNYIYEIYDAGLTFQYTAAEGKKNKVERLTYDNNVVEYCSYNIEYWNGTNEATNQELIKETYLGNIYFTNNILRYAGMGFTEVRPEHGYEALIKAWDGGSESWNRVKNEFIIENNIFDTTGQLKDKYGVLTGIWMLHIDTTNIESLPVFKNNKFYNYSNRNLGQIGSSDNVRAFIPYNSMVKNTEGYFEGNEFYIFDEPSRRTDKISGTTGSATWTLNFKTLELKISGSGAMADYTESSVAPWHQYKDYIKTITIDENVTKIGNYAFEGLEYVKIINYNAKTASNLANKNYAFSRVGRSTAGTKIIIGANVTMIPDYLLFPVSLTQEEKEQLKKSTKDFTPNITEYEFKGNKVTTIGKYSFAYLSFEFLLLPESVTSIGYGAFFYNRGLKVAKLPDNLTTLNGNVIGSCYNLEVVILGKNLTTLNANSLSNLKHLERLVITNPNFNFDPSANVFGITTTTENNVTTYKVPFESTGIQFFGPQSIETVVNSLKSIGVNAYYVSLDTYYRPMIWGDSKTFYALYDDFHYGESTKYEVKALANASVNITGAKYRYIDRFKHKYLFDGPNIDLNSNTLSNIYMDVELTGNIYNKDNKILDAKNVLYLGNSFLIGWSTHSMGSTDVDTDYYHYMNQYLKSLSPNVKSYRLAINHWEEVRKGDYSTTPTTYIPVDRNAEVQNLISQYNAKIDDPNNVDLFFIQLGENLANTSFPERQVNIESSFDYMISEFQKAYPNAKIIILYPHWIPSNIKTPILNVASKYNIDATLYGGYKGASKRYESFIGAKYYNFQNKVSYVTNEGVACHPNDYGSLNLANMAIDYLKKNLDTKTIEIKSTKYKIQNKTIIAKPTSKNYMRNELKNNITSDYDYDIYVGGVKLDTNTYVGTGSKVKVKDIEYKVIVRGDVTGDGIINLSDVSKLYNSYKKKTTLTGDYLEAGRITESSSVVLGDVSKLYNFYKGKINNI